MQMAQIQLPSWAGVSPATVAAWKIIAAGPPKDTATAMTPATAALSEKSLNKERFLSDKSK
jgi:hypothetical protein